MLVLPITIQLLAVDTLAQPITRRTVRLHITLPIRLRTTLIRHQAAVMLPRLTRRRMVRLATRRHRTFIRFQAADTQLHRIPHPVMDRRATRHREAVTGRLLTYTRRLEPVTVTHRQVIRRLVMGRQVIRRLVMGRRRMGRQVIRRPVMDPHLMARLNTQRHLMARLRTARPNIQARLMAHLNTQRLPAVLGGLREPGPGSRIFGISSKASLNEILANPNQL